jgi:preprotein translocase subunit SecG
MTIPHVRIISMAYVAVTIQILSGLALITLILLHSPKGEGLGGIGSSASLFTGPSQAEAGLDRVTWVAASVFILSSALLGWGIIQF